MWKLRVARKASSLKSPWMYSFGMLSKFSLIYHWFGCHIHAEHHHWLASRGLVTPSGCCCGACCWFASAGCCSCCFFCCASDAWCSWSFLIGFCWTNSGSTSQDLGQHCCGWFLHNAEGRFCSLIKVFLIIYIYCWSSKYSLPDSLIVFSIWLIFVQKVLNSSLYTTWNCGVTPPNLKIKLPVNAWSYKNPRNLTLF